MTFAAAFPRMFSAPFKPDLAADVVASWWIVPGKTCVAAYQPKGAASLAASYTNLANPGTYDASPGGAPTLTADGWSFNGSTQWLISVPWNQISCVIVALTPLATGYSTYWGVHLAFGHRTNGSRHYAYPSGYEFDFASPVCISGTKLYCGGVYKRDVDAYTPDARKIGLGTSLGYGDLSLEKGACTISLFTCYSSALTAGEIAVVSAAMAAL